MTVNGNATQNGHHPRATVLDIQQRRAEAGKLLSGIASVGDSSRFRGPQTGKPLAKSFAHHLSSETKLRKPSRLKEAGRLLKGKPDIISVAGGLPPSENFPIENITFNFKNPNLEETNGSLSGDQSHLSATLGKYDTKDGGADYDLSIALNYSQTTGGPQLTRFLTEHSELVLHPPYADWKILLTTGSTGTFETLVRAYLDKERRDSVLTEAYNYSTVLETMRPQGIKVFGVSADDDGLSPSNFDEILSSWDETARGARKPHILYIIPTGQNPTGSTQSIERRREVYAVAQKHDVLIIEDDPYYFLQLGPYEKGGSVAEEPKTPKNGRVIRIDSASKVLAPGSRLGWVIGSEEILQNYIRVAELSNQVTNGFSQIIDYTLRRNVLLDVLDNHLPKDLISWIPPSGGMFVWLKLDHSRHPDFPKRSLEEIEQEIFEEAVNQGVLFARGSWFRAEPDIPVENIFFRLSFSTATKEQLTKAVQRLSAAIHKSFGL
uniref:Aminotransferase class I/classII large domain-containing protein n=1 Tax=Bionectria ochroleuca TaxID=29856 RepID=A0A8H7TR96_BIOOC